LNREHPEFVTVIQPDIGETPQTVSNRGGVDPEGGHLSGRSEVGRSRTGSTSGRASGTRAKTRTRIRARTRTKTRARIRARTGKWTGAKIWTGTRLGSVLGGRRCWRVSGWLSALKLHKVFFGIKRIHLIAPLKA